MKKVVAGISGGIDSAVTASLLKEEGYDVSGIHILVGDLDNAIAERLQKIEQHLNIPIQIIDACGRFQNSVINYFRREHLAGRSPSPCAICNPTFKWEILKENMLKTGADRIASGHYIQKEQIDGHWYLKKGEDQKKDQSYFLWGLDQEIIGKLIAPLGNNEKQTTRKLAKQHGLEFLLDTKESTGLCFSQGLAYKELIGKHIPEAKNIGQGPVKDDSGKIIGSHKGYIYYTIGQKKGLNLNTKGNFCVTGIFAKENTLVVSTPENLWKRSFEFDHHMFVNTKKILNNKKLQVKIRGFGWNPEGYAQIFQQSNDTYKVELENPAWAPAPGQPAVFYDNELLLGGGLIK